MQYIHLCFCCFPAPIHMKTEGKDIYEQLQSKTTHDPEKSLSPKFI